MIGTRLRRTARRSLAMLCRYVKSMVCYDMELLCFDVRTAERVGGQRSLKSSWQGRAEPHSQISQHNRVSRMSRGTTTKSISLGLHLLKTLHALEVHPAVLFDMILSTRTSQLVLPRSTGKLRCLQDVVLRHFEHPRVQVSDAAESSRKQQM